MADEEAVAPVELRTVRNVGGSAFDLDDGRTLAPGEVAEGVNVKHPHNDRLKLAGLLAVSEPPGDDDAPPPEHKPAHRAPAHKKEES